MLIKFQKILKHLIIRGKGLNMESLIRKGKVGELKVQQQLLLKGYNVYDNIVDDGGVDLIIEKENMYYKIQIKRATKRDKNQRLSFRLGDSNEFADFYICEYNEQYWVIPKKEIHSDAFQIYPDSQRGYNLFKDKWELLEGKEYLISNKEILIN
jgi:hypothetical protein